MSNFCVISQYTRIYEHFYLMNDEVCIMGNRSKKGVIAQITVEMEKTRSERSPSGA